MFRSSPLRRNLALAHLLSALYGARFGLAVWVLYYLLFTDYAGIGLVEAVTLVTAFVAEVPTGMLGDRLGRRRTLIASFAILGSGYLLLGTVRGLPGLLLSLFVLSVGRSLYSGTFEALLYDSLQAASTAARFPRELLRARAFTLGTSAVTTITGGWLYTVEPRLPFLVTAAVMAVATVVAALLREPPYALGTLHPSLLAETRRVWRRLLAAEARPSIVPLLCVGALVAVTEEVLDDVLAVELGYSPTGLGLLFAGVYLVAAAASGVAGRWAERWAPRSSALILGSIIAASLLPSPWMGIGLGGVAIALRAATRSFLDVASATAVNDLVPSQIRATAVSSFVAARNAPYVACAYAVGALMDRITGLYFAVAFGLVSLLVICALATVRFDSRSEPGGQAGSRGREAGSSSNRS